MSEQSTFNRKPIGVRAGEHCLCLPRSNARTPSGLRLNVNAILSLRLTSTERRMSLRFYLPTAHCPLPNDQ